MRGLSLLRRGSVRLGGNDLRLAGERRPRLGDGAKTRIDFRTIHRGGGETRFRRATNRPLRWNDLVEASGVVGAQPGVLSRSPLSDPSGADQAKENVTRMIRPCRSSSSSPTSPPSRSRIRKFLPASPFYHNSRPFPCSIPLLALPLFST